MDKYSRYPVVKIIQSWRTKNRNTGLGKIFSMLEGPVTLKSDNSAPMNLEAFRNFANYLGIEHRKITLLWPKANSECERFSQTICKAICAACVKHMNWKQEMLIFFRNHRASKHSTLNKAPAEILFSRNIKTRLPQMTLKSSDMELRDTYKYKKAKMNLGLGRGGARGGQAPPNNLKGGANIPFGPPQ